MKKADAILLAAVLMIAAILFLLLNYFKKNNDSLYVQIMIDNQIVEYIPLNDSFEKAYKTDNGYNIITIKGNNCYVSESDCANQICVNTGIINEVGETIVCLPHRFCACVVDEVN